MIWFHNRIITIGKWEVSHSGPEVKQSMLLIKNKITNQSEEMYSNAQICPDLSIFRFKGEVGGMEPRVVTMFLQVEKFHLDLVWLSKGEDGEELIVLS